MNVLLDANVWISAFLNPAGPPAQLRTAWFQHRFTAVVAPTLLDEIRATLTEPRLSRKYGVVRAEVESFIELLLLRSVVVFPTGAVKRCRDRRDDFLLEAALLGRAEYLVSRDDDLKGVQIVSVRQFLRHLR